MILYIYLYILGLLGHPPPVRDPGAANCPCYAAAAHCGHDCCGAHRPSRRRASVDTKLYFRPAWAAFSLPKLVIGIVYFPTLTTIMTYSLLCDTQKFMY